MAADSDSSQKVKLIAAAVILAIAVGLLVWNFLPEPPPPGAIDPAAAETPQTPAPGEPPPKNRARAPQ
jgi:hypothetical protein